MSHALARLPAFYYFGRLKKMLNLFLAQRRVIPCTSAKRKYDAGNNNDYTFNRRFAQRGHGLFLPTIGPYCTPGARTVTTSIAWREGIIAPRPRFFFTLAYRRIILCYRIPAFAVGQNP